MSTPNIDTSIVPEDTLTLDVVQQENMDSLHMFFKEEGHVNHLIPCTIVRNAKGQKESTPKPWKNGEVYTKFTQNSIAMRTGSTASGCNVVDVDTKDLDKLTEPWRSWVEDRLRLKDSFIVETYNGYHIYIDLSDLPEDFKLRTSTKTDSEGGHIPYVDFRGEHGLIFVASKAEKVSYRVIADAAPTKDLEAIAALLPNEDNTSGAGGDLDPLEEAVLDSRRRYPYDEVLQMLMATSDEYLGRDWLLRIVASAWALLSDEDRQALNDKGHRKFSVLIYKWTKAKWEDKRETSVIEGVVKSVTSGKFGAVFSGGTLVNEAREGGYELPRENEEPLEPGSEEFADYHPVIVGNSLRIFFWAHEPRVRGEEEYLHKVFRLFKKQDLTDTFTGDTRDEFLKWFKSAQRPTYQGIYFNPNPNIEKPDYINLWSGFSCEPVEGDVSPFLDLLENVSCSGIEEEYEYLKKYIGHQFQKPTEKPGVAIVHKGAKGIGKDTIHDSIGGLYNDAYIAVSNKSQVTGKFNRHLANVIMMSAAEQVFAGSHEEDGVMKNLITNPSLAIEPKGQDVINVESYLRVWMSSNQDWVVPATGDERRYFIPTMSDVRKQDTEYFKKYWAWYHNGGKEAILYWALNMDIKGFDVRKYPDTKGAAEQKVLTMDNFQTTLFEYLSSDDLKMRGGILKSTVIVDAYNRRYAKYPTNTKSMGHKLAKLFGKSTALWVEGKTIRGWKIPLQEAREILAEDVGDPDLFSESEDARDDDHHASTDDIGMEDMIRIVETLNLFEKLD